MYHHQQGGSSYEYPSYPGQSYAPPAAQPPVGRAIRPTPTTSQPPQTQPYASSAAYPSGAYNAQQWPAEPWTGQQYGQTFASPPMHADVSYAPRTDPPSQEARFSSSSLSQAQEPSSGYTTATPAPSTPRNKRKDKESPPAPSGLDFYKMQDSYRLILDSGTGLLQSRAFVQSRPLPAEPMEQMVQSANYGRQVLQSATAQSSPAPVPAPAPDKEAPASKRQRGDEQTPDGQTCLGCSATSTPEWRRGPLGEAFPCLCGRRG